MPATVEVRLIGSDLADTMRRMRMWLDHRRVAPHAFRQSSCPGGLALHVEFEAPEAADEFCRSFGGRVLGAIPPIQTSR